MDIDSMPEPALRAGSTVPGDKEARLDTTPPTVFIVDDDPDLRNAISVLLDLVDIRHELYSSGAEFLEKVPDSRPGCLILDVRMPGVGGLEVQRRLAERGCSRPIVFMTGHGNIPMAVQTLRRGALDFLEKPFRDDDLLDRIAKALAAEKSIRQLKARARAVRRRREMLTDRERQVCDLVVRGKSNRLIAYDIGISQRTVEVYRARAMQKMKAQSLPDLVRMHELL